MAPSIFCLSVTKMSEKAQRMDLLSLSEAKEKTNIKNILLLLDPRHKALGSGRKTAKMLCLKKVCREGRKHHSVAQTHNNVIKSTAQ